MMRDGLMIVSGAPHVNHLLTTKKAMRMVLVALTPAALFGVWVFGWRALLLIGLSVGAGVLTEYVIQKLQGKTVTIADGSAALSGLLLALTVTPQLPAWMIVIGAVVAVGLAKQIFGGLGHNPFNPALIGRAFMLASWPEAMADWIWPAHSLDWAGLKIDAVAGATALNLEKMGILEQLHLKIPYWNLFCGNIAGSIGETSALLLLSGGIYLLWTGVIDWRIPLAFIGTVAGLALVFQKDPLFQILAGGVFFGAFFMATDWVTSPVTSKGRIYFGIGCGILTVLIRIFGGYPEGVCYSILMMNALTPLLDRMTIPKRFGEVKKHAGLSAVNCSIADDQRCCRGPVGFG